MDRAPERADRPRSTSIQHLESPDAAEAHVWLTSAPLTRPRPRTRPGTPDRRPIARGSAPVAGSRGATGAAPDPARGTARVRPPAPAGPELSRPVLADVQTTSGVPATPIPDPAARRPLVSDEEAAASLRTGAPSANRAVRAVDGVGEATEIIIRDDAPGADHATAKTSTIAPPPADPVPAVIPAPAEHPTDVLPRIPGGDARPIPVVPGLPVAALLEQPPQPAGERRRVPRATGPYDLGQSPAVLLLSSLGVLLVALAYAGGREGTAGATVAYWIGQVVVFTPVVLRLLSRRMAGVAESFLLVMGLAVNQYLLKWMYSPDQFRFPDELQHWLATTTVLETGELFQPNRALPPAVHFPGLAEMGAAVASMTGLPVTAAGILVAGVAHLVFVGVLFASCCGPATHPRSPGSPAPRTPPLCTICSSARCSCTRPRRCRSSCSPSGRPAGGGRKAAGRSWPWRSPRSR